MQWWDTIMSQCHGGVRDFGGAFRAFGVGWRALTPLHDDAPDSCGGAAPVVRAPLPWHGFPACGRCWSVFHDVIRGGSEVTLFQSGDLALILELLFCFCMSFLLLKFQREVMGKNGTQFSFYTKHWVPIEKTSNQPTHLMPNIDDDIQSLIISRIVADR